MDYNETSSLMSSLYNYSIKARTVDKVEIKDALSKQGFIAYRILTTFYTNTNTSVDTFRRYSEFQKLNLYFRHLYDSKGKFVLFPKFPVKHGVQDRIMSLDQNSKRQFEDQRKEDLEIYLNLLIEIPGIKENKILIQFLNGSQLLELAKEIEKSELSLPSTTHEKAFQAVKSTLNSVYKFIETWNSPLFPVKDTLRNKITKIQQVRHSVNQLLLNQINRIKIINAKQYELACLKSRNDNGESRSILQGIKSLLSTNQGTQSANWLPCVQMLYNHIEEKFKSEKENMERIETIKKELKIVIARCDSVLICFQELVSEKAEALQIQTKLEALDQSVDVAKYVEIAVKILEQYHRFYRTINRLGQSESNHKYLDPVNEVEQSDI